MTVCEDAQKENEDQSEKSQNSLKNNRFYNTNKNNVEKSFEHGDIIWTKVSHNSLWWPAILVSDSLSNTAENENESLNNRQKQYYVSTLGAISPEKNDTAEYYWVKASQIAKYNSSYDYATLIIKAHKLRSENGNTAIPKDLRQLWRRANIDAIELKSTMNLKARLEKFKAGLRQRNYALPEEAVKTLHFDRKKDEPLAWKSRKNCSLMRALRNVRKRKYGDFNSDGADSSADESLHCPSPCLRSEGMSDDNRNTASETETLSENSFLQRKKTKRKLKSLTTDLATQETASKLEALTKGAEAVENEARIKHGRFKWRSRSVLTSYEWSDFIQDPSSYKNSVCKLCETKGDLLLCRTCVTFYHRLCYSLTYPDRDIGEAISFLCLNCQESAVSCFSCGDTIVDYQHESVKLCSVKFCQKAYHETCIEQYKVKLEKDAEEVVNEYPTSKFICPRHVCATCYTSDPHDSNFSQGKFIKCHRCPLAYHTNNDDICIPAGSNILSSTYLVCPLHFPSSSSKKVNVNWCFFCSTGGNLICCEYCPAAFHRACLPKNEEIPDENHWLCENCRCGSFPKYGDVVWAKLGIYRWWPACIAWPWSIPNAVMRASNLMGEYVVEFFGTHNFSWLPGDRVFLFEENDEKKTLICNDKNATGLTKRFEIGMKEIAAAYKAQCLRNEEKVVEVQRKQDNASRPASYRYLSQNRPVPPAKIRTATVDESSVCSCKPNDANPCGPDSNCMNRITYMECHPASCPALDKCQNQRFRNFEYVNTEVFKSTNRGWGLRTVVDVKTDVFIGEYCGELIDRAECSRRVTQQNFSQNYNFYFCELDKDRVIDASKKGNHLRFLNHSCDPNCSTQVWLVNGDFRVGVFTIRDISANEELTFNYNFEALGETKIRCFCGSECCSGYIGSKSKSAVESAAVVPQRNQKGRKSKLKPPSVTFTSSSNSTTDTSSTISGTTSTSSGASSALSANESEDVCFRCGDGGELLLCSRPKCCKGYHFECVEMNEGAVPKGRWSCPWHFCDVCGAKSVYHCNSCYNSACDLHYKGHIIVSDLTTGILQCKYCLNTASENEEDKEGRTINESSSGAEKGDLDVDEIAKKCLNSLSESLLNMLSLNNVNENSVKNNKKNDTKRNTKQFSINSDSEPELDHKSNHEEDSLPVDKTVAKMTEIEREKPEELDSVKSDPKSSTGNISGQNETSAV